MVIVEPEITLRSALLDFAFFAGKMAISAVMLQWTYDMMSSFGDESKAKGQKNKAALRKRLGRQGRPNIETNTYEDQIAGDLVRTEDIDVTFDMIGGLEDQKREIYNVVVLPLKRPDLFASCSKLLAPPNGVLFYGPPGTGKTMLAKAIAKESGATFINLKLSTMLNKWFGESNKLVRAVFSLAKKMAPTIIFIDEIDAFLRARASDDITALANMKAEFMALWDGLLSGNDESDLGEDGEDGKQGGTDKSNPNRFGVMVIGCSNRPYDIDDAILRRMPRAFHVSLPLAPQREDILRLTLKDETVSDDVDLSRVAAQTEAFSGSDLKELCRVAAFQPFDEFMRAHTRAERGAADGAAEAEAALAGGASSKPRPISQRDFDAALTRVRPTARVAEEYRHLGAAESVRGLRPPSAASPGEAPGFDIEALQRMFAGTQLSELLRASFAPDGREASGVSVSSEMQSSAGVRERSNEGKKDDVGPIDVPTDTNASTSRSSPLAASPFTTSPHQSLSERARAARATPHGARMSLSERAKAKLASGDADDDTLRDALNALSKANEEPRDGTYVAMPPPVSNPKAQTRPPFRPIQRGLGR
jgi:DNA polymerase III delta prime subunit